MLTRGTSHNILRGVVASVLMSCVAAAADDAPAAPPAPPKEMRAKMASLHEQMAACLRSDRPFNDCRSEMMKGCQQLMGEQGCPMGMGMRNHMMKAPGSDAPKDKK
jgi:hypothetical protein